MAPEDVVFLKRSEMNAEQYAAFRHHYPINDNKWLQNAMNTGLKGFEFRASRMKDSRNETEVRIQVKRCVIIFYAFVNSVSF